MGIILGIVILPFSLGRFSFSLNLVVWALDVALHMMVWVWRFIRLRLLVSSVYGATGSIRILCAG